jgi:hypothetical protein
VCRCVWDTPEGEREKGRGRGRKGKGWVHTANLEKKELPSPSCMRSPRVARRDARGDIAPIDAAADGERRTGRREEGEEEGGRRKAVAGATAAMIARRSCRE